MTLPLLARRFLDFVISIFIVVTVVFLLVRVLPGDPIAAILAEAGAPKDEIQRWEEVYGLDRPLPVQYLLYLKSVAVGDLGVSILYGRSVGKVILEQLPATLELTLVSFAISATLGVVSGLLSAWLEGSIIDVLVRLLCVVSVSLPLYLTGILFITVFAATLRWLPVTGAGTWRHLVLPAATLSLASFGVIARLVRASLLDAASQPHIQVAKAKGLPLLLLILRHWVRPAAAPIIAYLALQAGFLLAGTAVTETVFSRPGIGRLLVDAVLANDYPLAQGCILLAVITYSVAGAVGDFFSMAVDPRIRAR